MSRLGMMVGSGFLRRTEGFFEVCGVPLERVFLFRLIRLAQRNGVLFRYLNAAEHKFVRLVVSVTKVVRSIVLAKALAPIVKKLLEALKGFPKLMIEVLGKVRYWMMVKGWEKAKEISHVAQRWGNREARRWAEDVGFARYLTIVNMYLWESERQH